MTGEFLTNLNNTASTAPIWGFISGLVLGLLIVMILVFIGIYIYHAIAWSRIGRNQKYKRHWLAWIPFANLSMILEMGGFHWAWVFLVLIPIAGWIAILVLLTISMWRVFEKAKYPGWLSLSYVLVLIPIISILFWIAYLIIIGFVAWKKKKR
ncbi:MAG: DUF5684 domain-containing protein [Candidatus Pacearchaeota archaeon]|jgi:hypothetical protein